MNSGQYVFSQIVSFMSVYEFNKGVNRYHGNKGIRELNCWNQFLHLFFGQITGRNGLRDICTCLKAHQSSLYHLGIRQTVSFQGLSLANERRDWRIFSDFGRYLIKLVSPLYSNEELQNLDVVNPVFALDSTTISVSIKLWKWARGKYSRGAVKVHTLMDLHGNIPTFIHITDGKTHDVNALDFMDITTGAIYVMDRAYIDFRRLFLLEQAESCFVVRAKNNFRFETIESFKTGENNAVLSDREIRLKGYKSQKLYSKHLRRIEY